MKLKHSDVFIEAENKKVGDINTKIIEKNDYKVGTSHTGNTLLDNFIESRKISSQAVREYSRALLLRTYNKIAKNVANIGIAANAEMLLASIRIRNEELYKEISCNYNWDLERIIDATVKDGTDASEDLTAINGLIACLADNKIKIPYSLKSRIPKGYQADIEYDKNHPLDQLLDAIEYLINEADQEMLGRGSVSSGTRIPGMIDNIDVPVIEIGYEAIESELYDLGIKF